MTLEVGVHSGGSGEQLDLKATGFYNPTKCSPGSSPGDKNNYLQVDGIIDLYSEVLYYLKTNSGFYVKMTLTAMRFSVLEL